MQFDLNQIIKIENISQSLILNERRNFARNPRGKYRSDSVDVRTTKENKPKVVQWLSSSDIYQLQLFIKQIIGKIEVATVRESNPVKYQRVGNAF
jgi:hypothetical protein